ncbi:MAG: NAD-dependent epimerase/dehydratase family protein [archaeon]|nr:MAG: NAD-dependent epimerase/dehydratase family protein [archaeon]
MNLLVGATGFIGGHLVEYLFKQGEISKGTFRMGSHLKILDSNGVQVMEADLLDHHSLHEAMEGVDTVYNLASPMPGSDSDFMKVNTEGVLNLLETASEAKVRTFIHLSTLDVHGFSSKEVSDPSKTSPAGDYQTSKAEAERLLQEFAKRNPSTRVVIIRPAKAIGSRDSQLTAPVIRMMTDGKVVLPSSGTMSFSHPLDIAQAMYKAATGTSVSGSVFLTKSFDATPEALSTALGTELGKAAKFSKPGVFSRSALPEYTATQLRAALLLQAQGSWQSLGYSPSFDLASTCSEIAAWYRKDPWGAEEA